MKSRQNMNWKINGDFSSAVKPKIFLKMNYLVRNWIPVCIFSRMGALQQNWSKTKLNKTKFKD